MPLNLENTAALRGEAVEQATAAPGEVRKTGEIRKQKTSRSDLLTQFLLDNDFIPPMTQSFIIRGAVGRPLEISVDFYER